VTAGPTQRRKLDGKWFSSHWTVKTESIYFGEEKNRSKSSVMEKWAIRLQMKMLCSE
jgi:hypothetical protein